MKDENAIRSTVQLKFTGAAVWLSGLSFDGRYKLDHIVAHWGSTDAIGSEHTLDGTTFPGEVCLASNTIFAHQFTG